MLKAYIENILKRIGFDIDSIEMEEIGNDSDIFSYGLELKSGDKKLAETGCIRKNLLDTFDIKNEVFYADIRWDSIVKQTTGHKISYKELPKFPEVKRDMAILIDDSITYKQLINLVKKQNIEQIKNIGLFDVYKGKGIPEGKKSYAISFTIQDWKKTLTDNEIDEIIRKLAKVFTQSLHAEIR